MTKNRFSIRQALVCVTLFAIVFAVYRHSAVAATLLAIAVPAVYYSPTRFRTLALQFLGISLGLLLVPEVSGLRTFRGVWVGERVFFLADILSIGTVAGSVVVYFLELVFPLDRRKRRQNAGAGKVTGDEMQH